MNPEPATPEPQAPAPETPTTKTIAAVPPSVLALGFIAIVLLGVLVAVSLKDKSGKDTSTEDPALKEMKGRLQALQDNVNQDRAKLGLSPLYNAGNTESAEAVAKRITDDAATLVALSKGVSDLITTKDAERSKTANELTEALKRQTALLEELTKTKRERDEAVIEASTAGTARLQLEKASSTITTLTKEIESLKKGPLDLQARLATVTAERDALLARLTELEARVSKNSLFAGTEAELFTEAVELFRELRGLEGKPDSDIAQAYSQFGVKLGASVYGKLEFPTGSADLAPADIARVEAFPVEAADNAVIMVVGYASETGNVDANRALSSDRATAVARLLDATKKPGQRVQASYLGQTDRFGSQVPERNQICEVWQIVPKAE
ncbi:OmpA family protein [Luteolibacter sp. GHJ8]|uniref:OmpA family protein n=1 Tax=Luteolibacter rhizosphaerae TaxID=2989719 RepID=A0ABT3G7D4_9BACT|nr:OmpA family protein [Luteolibacter rhizosphaerae]MCW1915140.1 OmpA family protein [Luteolibacter rhizosphaerae]